MIGLLWLVEAPKPSKEFPLPEVQGILEVNTIYIPVWVSYAVSSITHDMYMMRLPPGMGGSITIFHKHSRVDSDECKRIATQIGLTWVRVERDFLKLPVPATHGAKQETKQRAKK